MFGPFSSDTGMMADVSIKSLDDIAALDEVVCIVLVVGLAFVGGLVVELDGPPLTTSSITSAPIGLLDGSGLVAGIGSCGVRSPSRFSCAVSSPSSFLGVLHQPRAAHLVLLRRQPCVVGPVAKPSSSAPTPPHPQPVVSMPEANNDPMAPIAVWEERQGSKSRARAAVTTMMF